MAVYNLAENVRPIPWNDKRYAINGERRLVQKWSNRSAWWNWRQFILPLLGVLATLACKKKILIDDCRSKTHLDSIICILEETNRVKIARNTNLDIACLYSKFWYFSCICGCFHWTGVWKLYACGWGAFKYGMSPINEECQPWKFPLHRH